MQPAPPSEGRDQPFLKEIRAMERVVYANGKKYLRVLTCGGVVELEVGEAEPPV